MTTALAMETPGLSPLDALLDHLRPRDLPVRVDEVAERLALRIAVKRLEGRDAELNENTRTISLGADEHGSPHPDGFTSRQRFSAAHEVAHWLARRWPHVMPDERRKEVQANIVAGEILLPWEAVHGALQMAGGGSGLPSVVVRLSSRAWVSREAAARRLLGLIGDAHLAEYELVGLGAELVWTTIAESRLKDASVLSYLSDETEAPGWEYLRLGRSRLLVARRPTPLRTAEMAPR